MRAEIRRRFEMVVRALRFTQANPDPSAGYQAAQATLEAGVERMEALAARQRSGRLAAQAATARKRDLRDALDQTFLAHVSRVGVLAADVAPELSGRFRRRRENESYHAFRTAAGVAVELAKAHRDVLVRHGLAEALLERAERQLGELDAVTREAAEARRAHVGAGAELDRVIQELGRVVRVLDGLNRFRFGEEPAELAAWESATAVFGPGRASPATEAPGEEAGPGPSTRA